MMWRVASWAHEVDLFFRRRSKKDFGKINFWTSRSHNVYPNSGGKKGLQADLTGALFWVAYSQNSMEGGWHLYRITAEERLWDFQCLPTSFRGGWSRSRHHLHNAYRWSLTYRKHWSKFLPEQCLPNHQKFQQPYTGIIETISPTGFEVTQVFSWWTFKNKNPMFLRIFFTLASIVWRISWISSLWHSLLVVREKTKWILSLETILWAQHFRNKCCSAN